MDETLEWGLVGFGSALGSTTCVNSGGNMGILSHPPKI